ncbi:hypothetical protein V2J09_019176 [Rumex salicifolius]
MGWKYNIGLCLIAAVVIIWVVSAEFTQRIFLEYTQPFAITYLGISLMVIYLPLVAIRGWICHHMHLNSSKKRSYCAVFMNYLHHKSTPIKTNDGSDVRTRLISDEDLIERGEERHLNENNFEDQPPVLGWIHELGSWEIAKYSLYLTPIWFLAEYMSNSALANTSVASTTVLASTSGLFTLFFGSLLGQDDVNVAKMVAVFICMAGVFMTTFGKTWAPDEKFSLSESRRHTITGDIYGLLSALFNGLFTVLLKKISGSEGNKVDVQKVFGCIGLFTLVGLWWLAWPLTAVKLEPEFMLPQSPTTGEEVLLNAFLGSVMAVSVVWTTPLVATLGMSLTIPLAMVADMLLHGRRYSLIYVLGCLQVLWLQTSQTVASSSSRFLVPDRNWRLMMSNVTLENEVVQAQLYAKMVISAGKSIPRLKCNANSIIID